MQVLSVTPEIFPLIKTGGLADVTGALPLALAGKGVAMRTLIPGYPQVMAAFKKKKAVYQYPLLQGGKASVHAVKIAGLDLFVLDAPHLFDRPGGPYGNATGADWPEISYEEMPLKRLNDVGAFDHEMVAKEEKGTIWPLAPRTYHLAMSSGDERYGASPWT